MLSSTWHYLNIFVQKHIQTVHFDLENTMQESVRLRQEQLIDLLRTDTVLTIRDLSDRLNVSQLTIRRDLEALEDEGVIRRIHGGAKFIMAPQQAMDKGEVSFNIRRHSRVDEKRAIARAVLPFIENGQVIIQDASTTTLFLAQMLPDDLYITIITHSAFLPIELSARQNIQVISTGGVLHGTSLCYLGFEAETTVGQFHAHKAIFGAKGVTLHEGCTDAHFSEVKLKAAMAQRAQELWILADHSKIGNIALASFASLSRIHTLVTDEKADKEIVQMFQKKGVNVICAPIDETT